MTIFNFLKPKIFLTKTIDHKDQQIIKQKWQEIEELAKLGRPSNFSKAILDADKLLDFALSKMGYSGSLGDKLKTSRSRFSAKVYNEIWQAHNLRNRLVHQLSEIPHWSTKEAIERFRQGLKELGVL